MTKIKFPEPLLYNCFQKNNIVHNFQLFITGILLVRGKAELIMFKVVHLLSNLSYLYSRFVCHLGNNNQVCFKLFSLT